MAFRHFETSGEFYVRLDDISVKGNSNATVPVHSFNIYRDGVKIANTTELNYLDKDAPFGNHKYEIEVQYEDGVSPKVAVVISVLNPEVVAYIHFEAHNVFGDGTGYQIFLDSNANQYGNAIPVTSVMFTPDCNIPEDLPGKFSHSVPENAEMSCSPINWVVEGTVVTEIPAGIYDFVVVNPLPGWLIRVASSPNGRRDNYEFIPNGHYYFQAVPDPYLPGADIIMIDAPTAIENVTNHDVQAYAVEGGMKIMCTEPCEIQLYDLYGRRLHTTRASEETFISCPSGIYVLQLKSASGSKAIKMSVK